MTAERLFPQYMAESSAEIIHEKCARTHAKIVFRAMPWLVPFLLGFLFFIGLAHAAADGSPTAALQRIYTLPDPNFAAFHDTSQRPDHYTARIHEAALEKEACYRKAWGTNDLDFDFIVPGQDYKIERFDIVVLSQQDDAATASVRFENFGDAYDMRYSLKRSDGQWLIDDVAYDGQTLFGALSSPCDKP